MRARALLTVGLFALVVVALAGTAAAIDPRDLPALPSEPTTTSLPQWPVGCSSYVCTNPTTTVQPTTTVAPVGGGAAAPVLELPLSPPTSAAPRATTTTTTAKPVAVRTFGNGTHAVGSGAGQVRADTYTAPGGATCSWARLGASGRVLARGGSRAAQRVTINPADRHFRTSGCGTWRSVPPPTTTTTSLRPTTTTTTVPVAVWGTPCTTEGAAAVSSTGEPLRCARGTCSGFVAPRPLWRYAWCV